MGLHEVAVKLGLSYTSNKDAETKLAHYISKKFQEAAAIFIEHNFVKKSILDSGPKCSVLAP